MTVKQELKLVMPMNLKQVIAQYADTVNKTKCDAIRQFLDLEQDYPLRDLRTLKAPTKECKKVSLITPVKEAKVLKQEAAKLGLSLNSFILGRIADGLASEGYLDLPLYSEASRTTVLADDFFAHPSLELTEPVLDRLKAENVWPINAQDFKGLVTNYLTLAQVDLNQAPDITDYFIGHERKKVKIPTDRKFFNIIDDFADRRLGSRPQVLIQALVYWLETRKGEVAA